MKKNRNAIRIRGERAQEMASWLMKNSQGMTMSGIARASGLSLATVRRIMTDPPIWCHRSTTDRLGETYRAARAVESRRLPFSPAVEKQPQEKRGIVKRGSRSSTALVKRSRSRALPKC